MRKLDKWDKKIIAIAVPTVIVTLGFIAGITALCMYNAVAGLAALFVVMGGMLFIGFYATRRGVTVEKYIGGQNRAVRIALAEIHRRVTAVSPDITAYMNVYPCYSYFREGYMEDPIGVFAVQPQIFSSKLRLYPCSKPWVVVTAENVDYDFITDTVRTNINYIKEYYGIDRENNNA